MSFLLFALVTDIWAGHPAHPAVVNPVAYETFGRPAENISLAGEWEFVRCPHGGSARFSGTPEAWKWPEKTERVPVPGCWEAGGIGDPGMGIPNICQDNAPKRLRHVWSGSGWYRKSVDLPDAWKGKRIWLKIGGVLSRGWFFVNRHPVGLLEEYAGAWKYDVTDFVKFGESNEIAVNADNEVASRTGRGEVNRWGGLVRDVELEATDELYIDDAWCSGDFDRREAVVNVEVEKAWASKIGKVWLRVTVEGMSVERSLDDSEVRSRRNEVDLATYDDNLAPFRDHGVSICIPLKDFRPWSPEHPNLYWAKIELLRDGHVVETRHERFGVRKLEVRGKELYLNGKPFFVRGCGDNEPFPISGCSPADRAVHRDNFSLIRAAGFNLVRLHTHGEIPEYMEAADEAGIMLQPEVPYYGDNPKDDFGYDPLRDIRARYVAFRRHPSFCVNSQGNEAMLGPGAGRVVYEFLRKYDPDRFTIEQDGGVYMRPDNGRGYADYCGGPLVPWPRGTYNPRAFVAHEYLNLSVRFDSRDEADYTGLWEPPVTRQQRAEWLSRFGLTSECWGDRLQDAQHALQAFWQKNGIELARQDPYCDGYCFWTVTDSVVYNDKAECFTAQGLFSPFHRPKRGGLSAQEFSVFNSPSCILLDNEGVDRPEPKEDVCWRRPCDPAYRINREGTNRVYTAGERIPAEFLFAHYGDGDLEDAKLEWRLVSEDGEVLDSGGKKIGTQRLGPARTLVKTGIRVPEVSRAVKARLEAQVESSEFSCTNSWDFWLFPKRADAPVPASGTVVVVWGSEEEKKALASGRNVVSLANQTGESNYAVGWWWIGKQAGTAFKRHPILDELPYEPNLCPLHFRVIKEGLKLPVEGFREEDMIGVGEGAESCYLYLAVRDLPNGRKHVLIAGLDVTTDTPEGRALLNGVYRWLDGR